MLDASTRLEANAIIDRLVADGETFPSEAARRLIALIPRTRRSFLSFIGRFSGPGTSFKGHAAGIGDVRMNGKRVEKTMKVGAEHSHKIGGYTVAHIPGRISIELMWAETKLDQTGMSCFIAYDLLTMQPTAMRIAAQRTLNVFPVTFGFITYVPWKKPDRPPTAPTA
jgi:hypothetical protein